MICRRASPSDATALHALRRRSILELAPNGMSAQQADAWAGSRTLESMEQRLEDTETWAAEIDGEIVGWVAVRDDYLDALYVDPRHAKRGIGTYLLLFVEDMLRHRGLRVIRADASANAETFYLRHGYELVKAGLLEAGLKARPTDEARPIRKWLSAEAPASQPRARPAEGTGDVRPKGARP